VAALASIKQQHPGPAERLRAYAQLFLDGFEKGMLPLCGALSAERAALPAACIPGCRSFSRSISTGWRACWRRGLAAGALRAGVSPKPVALLLLSTLEGGTFVGWALAEKGCGSRGLRGGAAQHRAPAPLQPEGDLSMTE
jgi:hypothetical protein